MGMHRTLEVLNAMARDRVVARYAIGGAVAAYNYVEATSTEDLDVLVAFEGAGHERASGLVTLGPILADLAARGYAEFRHEGIMVEGWPVQFLPVADDLDAEALAAAEAVELTIDPAQGPLITRVLRPEHLVAVALRVGRPKDRARILQFLDEEAVDPARLRDVLARHGLAPAWARFCAVAGIDDPCTPGAAP